MLMIPATLSNSLAFMMPVGTPPNAIAYGTGHVKIGHMIRAGFVLNIIGAIDRHALLLATPATGVRQNSKSASECFRLDHTLSPANQPVLKAAWKL